MRIIIVMQEPPLPFGSAPSRWYYVLLKTLVERGHNVSAFATCTFPPASCPLPPAIYRIFHVNEASVSVNRRVQNSRIKSCRKRLLTLFPVPVPYCINWLTQLHLNLYMGKTGLIN
jgi:hypothetical protein